MSADPPAILALDVETTGLPTKEPSDHIDQPHIVQLSCILFEPGGRELICYDRIVEPDGWIIPQETVDIHGISQERALAQGIPERQLIDEFYDIWRRSYLRVAHNVYFENKIVRIALKRLVSKESADVWSAGRSFCTMRGSTKVCKITQFNRGGFKNPKLGEAYQFFFKRRFEGKTHDSLADVRACKDIYLELVARGHVSLLGD